MRFAHLSDTHLGYRQYGLIDREKDFYNGFERIIDKIIKLDLDFVIHSGDLFDSSRPSTDALIVVQKEINKLTNAGIPFYAIAGNHDLSRRVNPIPPQVLFRDNGIKLISPIKPYFKEEDYFIGGVPYMPQNRNLAIKEKLETLSKKAKGSTNKILVLHQGIDKYIPQCELEIGDIPTNFNYYAMGHLHNYINDSYGEGRLVYPGSTEIWKSNELNDYNINGKGFVLVEMDDGHVETERISVDLPRKFINVNVDYKNLYTEIPKLTDQISKLELKPIININVFGSDFTSSEVYEYLNKELSDLSLSYRPTFDFKENDKDNIDYNPGPININRLIKDKLEDEGEKVVTFTIDLFDELSKDNLEDAENSVKDFYADRYGGD
ncbi:DNA repair exonuclease [uncultured Methanobrevibacter sp.]|uniref:metallophosphoesterase family protein n=1 Tax=uncultured Methanobrevibacter sp. TaxID=253161 RepID=UPI0025DB56AA|nr:DNA repair exonuclease [uncultured Methanobrevibacter sp.]